MIARESTDYFAVEDQVVSGAMRFIAANLEHPLRLEHIANEVAVSPRLLQLRFQSALGRGVSAEIRRLRLERVKRLLADPDRPIAAIATQAGFTSPAMLSQVFRRELGTSPSAYRNALLGG